MIIFYRGLGWLTIAVPGVGLFVALLLPRAHQDHVAAGSYVASAFVISAVDRWRRRRGARDELFFVPMAWWVPLLFAAGIAILVVGPLARGWIPQITQMK